MGLRWQAPQRGQLWGTVQIAAAAQKRALGSAVLAQQWVDGNTPEHYIGTSVA